MSDGPSWPQGLAVIAFLLFVLAAAVQWGYLGTNFVGGLTGAGLTVLGMIPLIAAVGIYLTEERSGYSRR